MAANEPLRPVRTGIWKRVLVDSPTLGVDEIYFEEGIATDGHGHDLSQAAYQVTGRFEVRLGTTTLTLGPGDGYAIPAGVDHSVRCIEKGSYVLITARAADIVHGDGHVHGAEAQPHAGHDH